MCTQAKTAVVVGAGDKALPVPSRVQVYHDEHIGMTHNCVAGVVGKEGGRRQTLEELRSVDVTPGKNLFSKVAAIGSEEGVERAGRPDRK